MTIIDTKEWAFWPFLIIFGTIWWFHYIENNRYTIFIVTAYNTLMCVNCISGNFSMTTHWTFSCRSIDPLTFLLLLLRSIGIKCNDDFVSGLEWYSVWFLIIFILGWSLLRYRLRVFPYRHRLFCIVCQCLNFQCSNSISTINKVIAWFCSCHPSGLSTRLIIFL